MVINHSLLYVMKYKTEAQVELCNHSFPLCQCFVIIFVNTKPVGIRTMSELDKVLNCEGSDCRPAPEASASSSNKTYAYFISTVQQNLFLKTF